MKKISYLVLLLLFLTQACAQENSHTKIINKQGNTIETRFNPPKTFKRIKSAENTFATYLRHLPLKPHGTTVRLYNGRKKLSINVYDAVVDLDIGNRDLHQCADAVMRLKAEYLWSQKRFDEIHFNFTNGFRVDYAEWMKGKRIRVQGNNTYWVNAAKPSNTYESFWKYMEIIFSYAGTISLSKELKLISIDKIKIGDVFIQGGSPGHAVIVVDMAVNTETGEKLFLLAQSYMPAQEIHILENPNNRKTSPWYSTKFGDILKTPEWSFKKADLKRFNP